MSGYERVVKFTDNPHDSTDVKLIRIECPDGKVALSGTGDINAPDEIAKDIVIHTIMESSGTAVAIKALESGDGTTADWGLVGFVVCVDGD